MTFQGKGAENAKSGRKEGRSPSGAESNFLGVAGDSGDGSDETGEVLERPGSLVGEFELSHRTGEEL